MAISGSPTDAEPVVIQRADQVERFALQAGVDARRARDIEIGSPWLRNRTPE